MKQDKFLQFQIVIEPDTPSGFHAYVPTLPGCHSAGVTREEARVHVVEGIQGYLKTLSTIKKKQFKPALQKEVLVEYLMVPA